MKQNALKYIIIFAIAVITGIFTVQAFILKSRFDLSEKQFNEGVLVALEEVAWQILEYNKEFYGHSADFNNLGPVERISNDYYIVNVNDVIDSEVLKYHLIEEFKKNLVNTDFEFAIYDCDTEQMKYGAYICANADTCKHEKTYDLPKSDKYTYYFGVHFPKRSQFFNARLKTSYVFTGLLLVIVLFFGYTTYVIIRQRQFSEIQKNFINNLTHELKTPISSIGLASKVLNDKKIIQNPERLSEYAKIIHEQNRRLSKNVEKVLNLGSLDKNRIQLKLENIELKNLIESVINQFKQAGNFKNTLLKSGAISEKLIVRADRFHFTQVLLNIIENAAKYCKVNPEIAIDTAIKKGGITIRISDNGIGIPKKERKKIFQKFYRIPTGNIHDVKGFGLGLDYVQKIIKAHKWKIKVEENSGGGSIFSIHIPYKRHGQSYLQDTAG